MTSLDFETTFHASRRSRIPEGAVQVAKDPNALHAKGFAVTTTESPVYTFFSLWLWYRAAQTATWASAADFEKLNFLAGVNRLSQVLVSKPLLFCLSVHSSSSSFSSSSSCGSSFTSPSTEHALLWRSTRAPASNPPGLLFSPLRTFTFARKSASPVSDLLSCFLFNASP